MLNDELAQMPVRGLASASGIRFGRCQCGGGREAVGDKNSRIASPGIIP